MGYHRLILLLQAGRFKVMTGQECGNPLVSMETLMSEVKVTISLKFEYIFIVVYIHFIYFMVHNLISLLKLLSHHSQVAHSLEIFLELNTAGLL